MEGYKLLKFVEDGIPVVGVESEIDGETEVILRHITAAGRHHAHIRHTGGFDSRKYKAERHFGKRDKMFKEASQPGRRIGWLSSDTTEIALTLLDLGQNSFRQSGEVQFINSLEKWIASFTPESV